MGKKKNKKKEQKSRQLKLLEDENVMADVKPLAVSFFFLNN